LLAQVCPFGVIERDQLRMPLQIVGPVSRQPALAFGPERAAQQRYDATPARQTSVANLMRPQRQQSHQLSFALLATR
jgi:hypothetical protein